MRDLKPEGIAISPLRLNMTSRKIVIEGWRKLSRKRSVAADRFLETFDDFADESSEIQHLR